MIPITQLPGEGNKAYEAFQLYLKLGDKRSMRLLSQKLTKTELMLRQWSSEFKWKERIKTYNYEQLQRERAAEDLAANALAELRVRRKAQLEANAWELYESFIEKVRGMLRFPLQTRTTTDEEGRNVVVMPGKWTFGDAARIMAAADAIGRMALGLPVGKHELTGANGESLIPVAAQPIFNVSFTKGSAKEEAEIARLVGKAPPGRKRGDAGLNGK
jgi:hypothetical protein